MTDPMLPIGPSHQRLFHSVGKTASMIAFNRSFTDIPYSAEMYDALTRHGMATKFEGTSPMAPRFEARHLVVDDLLQRSGVRQVLEVAAGFTTRGLSWSQIHPYGRYVELDTDAVIFDKEHLVAEITKDIPENLEFMSGNALEIGDLLRATSRCHPHRPLAVINEGMMPYFSHDDKAIFAENVRKLLERFGGVWITPDTLTREVLERQDAKAPGMLSAAIEATGKNMWTCAFDDLEHARQFFREHGFEIAEANFIDYTSQLTSPARLGLSEEHVRDVNTGVHAFSMSLAR